MKTKDIIHSGLKSFDTLLKFIKKKIDFDDTDPYKYKAIIEGRKSAFEVAVSQLTKIRQLEDADNCFNPKVHKQRLTNLVESTDSILKEITKVLEKEIDVDESEDERVKSIVQAKELSFDLLLTIINTRDTIQFTINNNKIENVGIQNLASDRVKAK